MGGIYGDMLLFYPEQRTSVNVFEMTPQINGGWEKDEESVKKISCIFQNTGGKQLKDSNGNLVEGNGLELWTETKNLDGFFTEIESEIFRLKSSNSWNKEGGFIRYSLEKVVGNNGTQSDNVTWNLGGNSIG